jgi:beta-phosphoglucomutase-like phosphatase (HAD superfamily)
VRSHLKRFSLLDQFDEIVTREDAARSKPHPDLYEIALSRLAVDAADAIAIEDSSNGVAAALAAGIRCIAFPNPVTVRQDLNSAHAVAGFDLWEQVAALAGISP